MAGTDMLRRSRRGKAAPAGVRQRRLQASATRPNRSQRALEAESGLGMEALLAHTCCAGACVTDGDGLQTTRARILTLKSSASSHAFGRALQSTVLRSCWHVCATPSVPAARAANVGSAKLAAVAAVCQGPMGKSMR